MLTVIIFSCGNLFLRIAGKIAKIRTRKNFVRHVLLFSFTVVPVFLLWLRGLMLRKVEMKINEKQTGSGKDRLRCFKKTLVPFECVPRLIISFNK